MSRPSLTVRGLQCVVRGYQLIVSPLLGPRCRFLPTCSHYALEAIESHGAGRGLWLTVRRLVRCHPWGSSGYDPVPQADVGGSFRARSQPRGPLS